MLAIRACTSADLREVWLLVQAAVAHMNAGGNPQWGPDYPTMTHYAQAIADGELYAACGGDGAILGVAVLNDRQEPCYDDLTGWRAQLPALGIHKVAVDPRVQGRGVASALFEYGFSMARARGLRSVRMDTYCLNGRMQGLMARHGFRYVGNIRFESRPLAFRAYEKLL